MLEKNFVQYDNVIDYLNSTIKGISFPGISFEVPTQQIVRGKKISYKPSTVVQDIVNHEVSVKFASVDADLNYWLLFDIITKHYLNVFEMFVKPFTLTTLDIHRDAIYRINFYQIILKGLDGNDFNYSQQKVNSKEFTLTFNFNFYDVEFLLTNEKVLEFSGIPQIIQQI